VCGAVVLTFPQDVVLAEVVGGAAELAVAVDIPPLVGQRLGHAHAAAQQRAAAGAPGRGQREQRSRWAHTTQGEH
jgi:hypothetical protein